MSYEEEFLDHRRKLLDLIQFLAQNNLWYLLTINEKELDHFVSKHSKGGD